MITKAVKLIRDPKRYWPAAIQIFRHKLKVAESKLAPRFANTAFFLQSQMDINPLSRWHRKEFIAQTGGYFVPGDARQRAIVDFDSWDLVRRDMLLLLLRAIVERNIPGDIAELGV